MHKVVGKASLAGGVFRPQSFALHLDDRRAELHQPVSFKLKHSTDKRPVVPPKSQQGLRASAR